MMEEKREGMCNSCCSWKGGHHHLIGMMLKLVIVIIVFWAGVKVGELKALYGYGSYWPGMMGGNGYRMMYYGPGPYPYMMYGATTTATGTPAK